MISGEKYRERIAKLRPNVFQKGKYIDRFDRTIVGGINVMASTYDFAMDPGFEGVGTATSHLTGEKISRFTHIHQSIEDLLNKQKMTRLYAQEVGGCVQRCMGIDGLNALSIATYDADQKHGTELQQALPGVPEEGAGRRPLPRLRPDGRQGQPRPGGRASSRTPTSMSASSRSGPDGIIVNGAKAHNSASVYADEIIALPTRNMMSDEKDWAVAFAIPADTEGVTLINAAFAPPQRKKLDAPHAHIGFSHSLTVFDHVFVPWERVFLCGETEQAGKVALYFALFHRHSYTGCKAALSEVVTGATALAAEYNGIDNAGHVRHKLAEMIQIVDLIYAAGHCRGGQRHPGGFRHVCPRHQLRQCRPDAGGRIDLRGIRVPRRHRRRAGGDTAQRRGLLRREDRALPGEVHHAQPQDIRRRTSTAPSGCSRT